MTGGKFKSEERLLSGKDRDPSPLTRQNFEVWQAQVTTCNDLILKECKKKNTFNMFIHFKT